MKRERVFTFPTSASGLNGACLLAPGILLIADGTAGLIWRVNLGSGAQAASASVWLRDTSMMAGWELPQVVLTPHVTIPYPSINGVRFAKATNHLYYMNCAQQRFARVAVDPQTWNPAGAPEMLEGDILSADDFCIDEVRGVAYLSTHVANTIRRVSLTPTDAPWKDVAVGDPFDDTLVGPSSLYWAPNAAGRVAYVTTDGGYLLPGPDGLRRPAALVRLTITDETSDE